MIKMHKNYKHSPLCRGGFFGCKCGKGGGSSTTVVQNTPATAAQSAEAINAWVAAMPKVFQTEMEYAPLQAQQQVQMAQQYALPLAQAYQSANEQLNPGVTALTKNLINTANTGATSTTMPDWMRQNYMNEMKAGLGSNVGSPIAADYTSRGMQKQLFEQQKYYQGLGAQLAGFGGAQAGGIQTAQAPQTNNFSGSFTPGSFMNWMGQNGSSTSNTNSSGGGGLFGGLFG
jgi:hypothetical protein